MKSSCRLLTFAFMSVLISSCGTKDSLPKVVPVTGEVLYQGKPVAGALVTFLGEGSATPAVGQTDAAGKFKLQTQDREGAAPGKYRVTVSKVETVGGAANANPSMDEAAKAPAVATQTKSSLPAKYGDSTQSPLEQTVTEAGPNEFKLDLKD